MLRPDIPVRRQRAAGSWAPPRQAALPPGAVSRSSAATAHAAGRMRVLCWPGYEEKPVVEEFEQKNDCKVEFKTYIGGEQMLQFFAQSPKGTFDAIISDAEYVQKLTAQKAIDVLKARRLPQSRRLPPEVPRFSAAARAGRQDLGSADALQLLRSLLQHQVHERGRGQDLEFAVPAQVQGQGRFVRLVPAQHEQCQPGGEARTTRRPTISPTPSSPR